jgi:segregation and condensation protein A
MDGTEDYKVSLEAFEGPLDLLLHLIKKEDLNIYDIPISRLLDQYLQYLQLAQDLAKALDIDLAGEFLEMASELTYIKSKMLLPEPPAEEEEGPDPRAELIRRLLEYQRYKAAAQSLISRPLLGHTVFARPPEEAEPQNEELSIEADTLSLISAFQDLLKRLPAETVHEINRERTGVSERILELTEFLKSRDKISFEDLILSGDEPKTRGRLVVTFLAILEMAKQRLLRILQEKVFCRIVICPLLSAEGGSDGIEGNP